MIKRVLYASEAPYQECEFINILWKNNFDVLYVDNLDRCVNEIYSSTDRILILEISDEGDFTFELFNRIYAKGYDIPTVVIYSNGLLEVLKDKDRNNKLLILKYPFDEKMFLKAVNDCYSSVKLTDKVVKTLLDLPEKMLEFYLHKEIGPSLFSSLDLNTVQKSIVKTAIKLLMAQEGALWVRSGVDGKTLILRDYHGLSVSNTKKERAIEIGEGMVGRVAQEIPPQLFNNIHDFSGFDPSVDFIGIENVNSMILVPLYFKNELLGILQLINKRDAKEFSSNDLNMATTFGGYASIALKNAQIYQRTQELTITDDHSRLYNFRFLEITLEKYMDNARRYNRHLSLVFIDLDNLKSVNDSYGHLMGSKVLSEIADLILPNIRTADLAVRYGGDEFVIMLPETNSHGALILAERLRRKFEEHVFLQGENLNVKITGSFGVATYPYHAMTKKGLLKADDSAMYEAKRMSRNRVCVSRFKGNNF